ncbi:MAG: hypothetical protein JW727_05460 [Candidatus Aenigmarchaeota archaeon]|nr:hypothetical protein [Candidatus Aenigmarchaeota archaeon]
MGQKTLVGGFSTKELTVCALFGALLFFLVFLLGAGVVTVTGIPVSGGLANMMVALLVLTIGKRIVDRFGSAALICVVSGILAIPTISWGPPGVYKVFLLLAIGLAYDIPYHLQRQNRWREFIAGGTVGVIAAPTMYLFLSVLGLPGADKLAPLVAVFMVVYAVLASAGAHFGKWIYETKLKNRAFLRALS